MKVKLVPTKSDCKNVFTNYSSLWFLPKQTDSPFLKTSIFLIPANFSCDKKPSENCFVFNENGRKDYMRPSKHDLIGKEKEKTAKSIKVTTAACYSCYLFNVNHKCESSYL